MKQPNKPKLHSFYQRLTKVSGWCLLVAVIVLLAEMVAVEIWLSPENIKESQQAQYLAHPKDDLTHVAWEALNSNPGLLPVQVYLIGGSTIREGVFDSAKMSKLLSEKLGRPAHFGVLGSSGQTLTESLGLVRLLPITKTTVMVVQVNPWRFSYKPEIKIPFIKAGGGTGLSSFQPAIWRERDYLGYYLNKRLSFPLLARINAKIKGKKSKTKGWEIFKFAGVDHFNPYNYTENYSAEKKRKMTLALKKYHPDFIKNYQVNMETLRKLITTQRARGVKVILLQGPHSESFLHGWGPHWTKQDREVAELCRQENIEYLRVPLEGLFADSDFIDLSHPNREGRGKFAAWIVDQVARAIDGNPKGQR